MIAIIIVNYNVPENTDSLVEYIIDKIKIPYKLHVIDNGSNKEFISKYTTLRIETNRNKLGGLLTGMHIAAKDNPNIYWNISTNMQFIDTELDHGHELISLLKDNVVAVNPYWTGELLDWTHKIFTKEENSIAHKVKQVGVYAMFNSEWLDSIGWFDPCLTSSWGTDFELGYLARKDKKIFLISDLVGYNIIKSKVTKLNRDVDNLNNYQKECNEELERVMTRKYGTNWRIVIGAYET
jgi:hypothetical protein